MIFRTLAKCQPDQTYNGNCIEPNSSPETMGSMVIEWQLEDDIFVISTWGLCILFLFYDQPKMVPDTSGNCVVSLKLQNLIILEKIAIEELHQQLLTFTRPEGKRKVIWNCPIIIRSYQTAIYSPSQSAPTILFSKHMTLKNGIE